MFSKEILCCIGPLILLTRASDYVIYSTYSCRIIFFKPNPKSIFVYFALEMQILLNLKQYYFPVYIRPVILVCCSNRINNYRCDYCRFDGLFMIYSESKATLSYISDFSAYIIVAANQKTWTLHGNQFLIFSSSSNHFVSLIESVFCCICFDSLVN